MADSPASTLLGATASLQVAILAVFSGRIYIRIRQKRFGWDDYSITLAMILALLEWSLIVAAIRFDLTHHATHVSKTNRIRTYHLLFASDLLRIPATTLARIGIAFTLLRFKESRPWRIFLSAIIGTQTLFCIINVVFQVVQCIPIQYVWNEERNRAAVCTATNSLLASQFVHAGIGAATDLMLALTPLSFMQRSFLLSREQLVLMFLVALGFFTTACSIVKTTLLKPFARPSENALRDALFITLWAILEEQAGLIAANIASFKSPPPPPPTRYNTSARRRRRNPKSRRTSSTTRADSYQLSPLHLSLKQHKHSRGVDTNVSSMTGSSTLRRTRSEEMIWSREYTGDASDRDREETPFQQMMAAGGILLTTELDVRSEVLSRAGSSEGGTARGKEVRREEWRIIEEGDRVRGDWSAV